MVLQVKSVDELSEQFKQAGDKLVVVDFFATWCGPCKLIAPKLEQINTELADKLVVLKVDVDESEQLASDYSINVMPTFILFRNGKQIDLLTGASEPKLRELIDKYLTAQ